MGVMMCLLPARTSTSRRRHTVFSLEKVDTQALCNGYSTKDGSIVTLDFQNSGMGEAGDYALVYMVFDGIVSIRDGTVDVLE